MAHPLDGFFRAESIAVVGASRQPDKVGHAVLEALQRGGFPGRLYPVNPNADEILGLKCYPSVSAIPGPVRQAVIVVPVEIALDAVKDCGKKGVTHIAMITAGFREAGHPEREEQLLKLLRKYRMRCIGPNILGVLDAHAKLDTLFLPVNRLTRPTPGGISIVSQSGAVGSALFDVAAAEGHGFAKFISYGNATDVDESDLLDYLAQDTDTKVVAMYLEGVRDGKKFIRACRKVTRQKPLVVIKGGMTAAGGKATMSHTGSLAGSAEVYAGAFKQAGVVTAQFLEQFLSMVKLFEHARAVPKGPRVAIITNGGGFGVEASDAVIEEGLQMAEFSKKTTRALAKVLPAITTAHNPLDVLGDATNERYRAAVDACMADPGVDIVLALALPQVPRVDLAGVAKIFGEAHQHGKKPIIVVTTGAAASTEFKKHLAPYGIPCFDFPETAVIAAKGLVEYWTRVRKQG
jgi:acetyltransferase